MIVDLKPYSFQTKEGHRFSGLGKEMHSVSDQPAVIYADGTRWWYRNNLIHREGGPAIIWANGVEEWWQNDKRHRADGPAVTYPNTAAIDASLRGVKQFWEQGRKVRETR
jgi:hypothetical protein